MLCKPGAQEQAGAVAQPTERFRKITDHDVIPAPSGAGALLLHAEEGPDCLVVLTVFRPADQARLAAIVTFRRCQQSIFGYPNDEAYWHDPRGTAGDSPGYGFFEVVNSAWPGQLIAYNRHAFPGRTSPHWPDMHHYFIGCHDASGQFLAAGMTVELTDGSYHDAVQEAMRRAAGPTGHR
jgi:hypothetical protein